MLVAAAAAAAAEEEEEEEEEEEGLCPMVMDMTRTVLLPLGAPPSADAAVLACFVNNDCNWASKAVRDAGSSESASSSPDARRWASSTAEVADTAGATGGPAAAAERFA